MSNKLKPELLDQIAASVGGFAALAAAVGVSANAPYMWRSRQKVPAEYCPDIERATAGAHTVEALRPDAPWSRIPDPTWPHPAGRPVIDVARPVVAEETA